MYVCMYVCMDVYIYIYMHIYKCIHIYVHMYKLDIWPIHFLFGDKQTIPCHKHLALTENGCI